MQWIFRIMILQLIAEREGKTCVAFADVIILEGIFGLYYPVLALSDLKIYVDTDLDLRLARRMQRDIVERGRDVESVLEQYLSTVKPSHEWHLLSPIKEECRYYYSWRQRI